MLSLIEIYSRHTRAGCSLPLFCFCMMSYNSLSYLKCTLILRGGFIVIKAHNCKYFAGFCPWLQLLYPKGACHSSPAPSLNNMLQHPCTLHLVSRHGVTIIILIIIIIIITIIIMMIINNQSHYWPRVCTKYFQNFSKAKSPNFQNHETHFCLHFKTK